MCVFSWKYIIKDKVIFWVIFDMRNDFKGIKDFSDIFRNMSWLVCYDEGKWFIVEKDGFFYLYNVFKNGKIGDFCEYKILILGFVFFFNENIGGLFFLLYDFEVLREFFLDFYGVLVGWELGWVVIDFSILVDRCEIL